MTRTLRTRHRIAIAALAVLLPIAVAVALVARPARLPAARLGVATLDERTIPAAERIPDRRGDER